MKACTDCGEQTKAHKDDPMPICDECADRFMARGGRSDPFWQHNDLAIQRSIDAEIGDL